MPGAFVVVALFEKGVVIGERVADERDQGEPGGRFARCRLKTSTVERVVGDRPEFVVRDVRRKAANGLLDGAAFRQANDL